MQHEYKSELWWLALLKGGPDLLHFRIDLLFRLDIWYGASLKKYKQSPATKTWHILFQAFYRTHADVKINMANIISMQLMCYS